MAPAGYSGILVSCLFDLGYELTNHALIQSPDPIKGRAVAGWLRVSRKEVMVSSCEVYMADSGDSVNIYLVDGQIHRG